MQKTDGNHIPEAVYEAEGRTRIRAKQYKHAYEGLEIGLGLHPGSEEITRLLLQARRLQANQDMQDGAWAFAYLNLKRILALAPGDELAKVNVGACLEKLQDYEGAVEWGKQAVTEVKTPEERGKAWLNLGVALQALGRNEEALAAYGEAWNCRRDDGAILGNICGLHMAMGELGKAYRAGIKAIGLQGAGTQAWHNLALAARQMGLVSESLGYFGEALKAGIPETISGSLLTLNYTKADPNVIKAKHAQGAKIYDVKESVKVKMHGRRSSGKRLRVGYVSGDFRRHSVAYFTLPVIKAHKALGKVEAVCYYTGRRGDEVTAMFKDEAAEFHEVGLVSDEELCYDIRGDHIDVLVDLSGHTDGNRLGVFARRAAPVQVHYVGYPATTGLRGMDWYVTDMHMDPPGFEKRYVEKLYRMSHSSAYCYEPIGQLDPAREFYQKVPGVEKVYGCFAPLPKIGRGCLETYGKILKKTGGMLYVKSMGLDDEQVRDGFIQRCLSAGIDVYQLILEGLKGSYEEHMACYRMVDVALDTWPYNGCTTTCEAMYMGVPVVTRAANCHAGRYGSSLVCNTQAGVVCRTNDEFVEQAVKAERRHKPREYLKTTRLMDAMLTTDELESFYARALKIA